MTAIKQNILRALRQANALTASEIARDITAHRDVVQAALHEMDDAGQVVMRNGFYRLSASARVVQPAEPMTRPGDVIHE